MSQTSDAMELREEDIKKHISVAGALLEGFDHAPRIGTPTGADTPTEKSSGIGTRRRFRSTTPGLVTQRNLAKSGVQLMARIANADDGDMLISPVQATVMHALRRGVAIALSVPLPKC